MTNLNFKTKVKLPEFDAEPSDILTVQVQTMLPWQKNGASIFVSPDTNKICNGIMEELICRDILKKLVEQTKERGIDKEEIEYQVLPMIEPLWEGEEYKNLVWGMVLYKINEAAGEV